ncbi:hypothetical protein Enr13x_76160 [Stieleria neptunia]|uniref:Uncharacterized protein n=1 Tax=Stieleria neptunia TaxID=2527979 RepID=A0A518I3M6_9BACT|nr:hypothetical protein [Stieleria neptunia]QDV47705.1 hypothetical protein Enr13x_76160 [Stieleria neptunia]
MKPNNSLNRKTLLQLVRRRLDRVSAVGAGSADVRIEDRDGDVLGRVVRQLMQELSPDTPHRADETGSALPVPLHDIAAYVDGTLDDPEKTTAITEAARSDPGLMMEIVAAIRSRGEAKTVGLAPDLRSRLIALQQTKTPSADTATVATERPPSDRPSTPPLVRTTKPAAADATRVNGAAIVWFATAAAVLLAIGWWVGSGMKPTNDPIAEDGQRIESPGPVVPDPNDDADPSTGQLDRQAPMLAEHPESESSQQPDVAPMPAIEPPADRKPAAPSDIAVAPDVPADAPRVAVESTPDGTPDDTPTPGTPNRETRPMVPRLPQKLVARWSQIDGLLLRSDLLLRRESSVAAADSSSDESTPASVMVGSAFDLAAEGPGRVMKLQTLPLCRATATLAGGGELVIAADTELELTPGGTIHLLHGSIALLGLNENSVVRLGRSIANSVSLQGVASDGQGGGDVVVRKTVTGMEVDVTGKPVKVNEQSVADSRLKLEGPLLAVEPVEEAPERLPRWTRERVDRIEVGRNVLAQLSESEDVRATLMQALASGAVRGDAAATVRAWLVAASGDQLLRLIGSPDPLLREAALQHLRTVSPNDPRHRLLWRRLQAGGKNARTFATVRSFFVDLWSGRRPNATKREQLLRMLQAPEPAARVTANYLLRSFYGTGPRFDLNASASARTRAANAWRAVINRVDQR